MKPMTIKEKIATILTEKLLKDLADTPSVGKRFIADSRPAITRLFQELSEERQALLMYLMRQTAKTHKQDRSFDIDSITQRGPLALENIDQKRLEKMRREVQYVHGVVASTVLVSYGGLSEQRVAVEG